MEQDLLTISQAEVIVSENNDGPALLGHFVLPDESICTFEIPIRDHQPEDKAREVLHELISNQYRSQNDGIY